ncbi:hypothetical protein Sdiek1_0227 [Sulfurospirillum diekertiae]|uniref:Uncharacterized protein n=1 Tax=Sulfurospirillum diekertiae TaxID=1854492 RepID=A0A1Y0HHG8_9BACT|nr:hypothetical protein [Sulfurospirillum diekertiae]ARU47410.1 hypothetical protein Sdiek1_0227 [Sulfurospirillum diekertiae]
MDCNYEKIYEQYWLHARHAEIQRWHFVATTMIITGGLLAILKLNENATFVFIFLAIFYALGLFVLKSLRTPFIIFSRLAEIIALNELKMDRKYARFFPQNNSSLVQEKEKKNYYHWAEKKI